MGIHLKYRGKLAIKHRDADLAAYMIPLTILTHY